MVPDRLQQALAALGHKTRLGVVQAIAAAPDGSATPSAVADAIGIPRNLLSAHLLILQRAGLVVGEERGRNRILRLDHRVMTEVGTAVSALADRPSPSDTATD